METLIQIRYKSVRHRLRTKKKARIASVSSTNEHQVHWNLIRKVWCRRSVNERRGQTHAASGNEPLGSLHPLWGCAVSYGCVSSPSAAPFDRLLVHVPAAALGLPALVPAAGATLAGSTREGWLFGCSRAGVGWPFFARRAGYFLYSARNPLDHSPRGCGSGLCHSLAFTGFLPLALGVLFLTALARLVRGLAPVIPCCKITDVVRGKWAS